MVRHVAEQLGLEGSYIPRTYIEQIQLEKLVNDVMVCHPRLHQDARHALGWLLIQRCYF